MPRLLDRQRQIPNGFRFFDPSIKFTAQPWSSFDRIVQDLMQARLGNPEIVRNTGKPTTRAAIEMEVDQFNARICEQMGWKDFITGGDGASAIPFPQAPPTIQEQSKIGAAAASIKRIWSGVRTLNDWLDSGEPAVASELSAARAAVCAACPKNGKGDFSTWFSKPASEAIRRQLERVQDRNLSTPSDEEINVCDVCLCPLKLKAHTPFHWVKKHLSDDVTTELRRVPNCWIIKELGG